MVTLKNVDIDSNLILFSSLFLLSVIAGCSPSQGHPLSKYVEGQSLFSTQHPAPLAAGLSSPLSIICTADTGTCLSPQS